MLSRNMGKRTPSTLSPSASLSEKELIRSSGALIFAAVAQGTPPDHLALGASRAYACSSTGLYIFACFKSCCLKVWLLNLPESRC